MKLDLTDPLHRDFAKMLSVYEQLLSAKNGRNQLAHRVRGMLTRKTVEEILEGWALNSKTTGFELLVEHGMPELTGEALVLDYPERFSPLTVYAAHAKVASRVAGTKPMPKRPRRGKGSY